MDELIKYHPPKELPKEAAASLENYLDCLDKEKDHGKILKSRLRFLYIISPYVMDNYNTGIFWERYVTTLLNKHHIKIPNLNDTEWNYSKKDAAAKYSIRVQ